ncbi:thaumatin-like protein 1 [Lotus japonicus]|uniref:thaumatin-like protein 1 n=1 Tax=Lotus japonicus TaxID=34305 RepID=UPI00258AEA7E|nr:thaumatin-like protein 1 [Lotus japonicus]
MAESIAFATTSIIVLFLLAHSPGSNSATIKLVNHSKYIVWPVIVSRQGAISSPLAFTTGFALQPNESIFMVVPASWSGHIWGRTLCSQDPTEKFSCVTGNCGSLSMGCVGGDLNSSATVAELTLSNIGKLNSYRLNLAYRYNLPMKVQPLGEVSTSYMVASCTIDLNKECPEELKVIREGEVVACKSGCQQVFGGSTQYNCPSSNYLITFQPTR